MFQLQLNRQSSLLKFDELLPVYNWYYPFPDEEDRPIEPALALGQIRTGQVRRRALYFHLPFCDTICSFCPFHRSGYHHQSSQVARYLQALSREVAWKASYPGIGQVPVDVIAVGGGTPSVLSAEEIWQFGQLLRTHFDLSRLREFTFEVEVKSVTREKIAAMQGIGVNRISFGAQTFSPTYRELFNLTATVDQVQQVARWLTESFPYVNADIIYGLPGQTLDDLLEDVAHALALGTTTVDFYLLNNMAASARMLRTAKERGLKGLSAATKVSYRMYLDEYLRAQGYAPVSGYSYARGPAHLGTRPSILPAPTFQYHDMVYGYADEEIVGFGSGSFTYLRDFNFYNLPERERYISSFLEGGEIPTLAFSRPECPEKGLVYFPYRGTLDRSRIDWERVPADTLLAFEQACGEGLIEARGDQYFVSHAGWLFYVNLIYFLLPERGRRWLSDRIDQSIREGRDPDVTKLITLS